MIRALIFDCFGVLTGDSWKEFLATLPETKREEVRQIHRAYDRGFVGYQDFREQAQSIASADKTAIDAIFLHTTEGHKNTQLLQHINHLHQTYKTGILSNAGTAWMRDTFLSSEENSYFDDMILSFEVGLSKPDRQIYQLACERLSVQPQEVIFIDDLEPFCAAAREYGMHAIQYESFTQYSKELNQILADSNK